MAEDRLAVDESEDENEDEESFLMSEPVWQGDLSGHSEELFCGYACMLNCKLSCKLSCKFQKKIFQKNFLVSKNF